MDENSILDESLMKSQSEAAISKITSENDKLTELKKSYSLIVEDESLKGEAATTFRQQMADYKIIIDSAIEANRCDIEDHNSLINLLGSYYYDGYTILANKQKASDEKESDIKERDRCHDAWLNSKPWQILSSDYYFYRYLWYCHEVEMDEAEYQKWLKKEEEYDEKESSSMSLFESGDDIREIFYSALDVIPLNFKNGNYVESPNLVWKEKLADAIRKGWYDESNGTRKYNLDKLAEIIKRNPEDIGYYEYVALCDAFHDLSDEEKARFIESAYLAGEKNIDNFSGNSCKYDYKVSEAFQVMTIIYSQTYLSEFDKNSQEDNERLNDFNLLYTFAVINPTLYVDGVAFPENKGKLEISIGRNGNIPYNDYNIHINASNKVYTDKGKLTLGVVLDYTVYSYRDSLDFVSDQAVKTKISGLKVDINNQGLTHAAAVARDVAIGCVKDIPTLGGIGITIGIGVLDEVDDYNNAVKTNETVDESTKMIDSINILNALGVGGSMIVDQDGNAYITNPQYDSEKIKSDVKDYNDKYGTNITINPDQMIQDIVNNGTCETSPEFDGYVDAKISGDSYH